jgi:predicted nucleic acid-binding protein
MIVVDTNIIVYALFPSLYAQDVTELHNKQSHWYIPVLWRSEFTNVVSLYLRKKAIDVQKAHLMIEAAHTFIQSEYEISQKAVLNFTQRSTCTSYDCEFICLADALKTRLITYNKKILNEFPEIAMKPMDYIQLLK